LHELAQTDLHFWVGGDFNINLKKHNFETTKLLEFIDEQALHKLVDANTWERVVTLSDGSLTLRSSQIDHVFANVKDSRVDVDDKWTSDHKLLILTTPLDFPQLERKKTTIRSWRNFNTQNLNSSILEALVLEETDPSSDLHSSDPNLLNDKINLLLKNSFDKICPLRVARTARPDDVVSDSIERIKKKRKRTLQKYNKTKDSSLLLIIRQLDSRLKSTIRLIKKSIVQQKLKSSNSKSFWNAIKNLQGEQKNTAPLMLKVDGNLINDESAISNAFGAFFAEKVSRLSMDTGQYNWVRSDSVVGVTEEELDNAIKSLKPKMCSGHDKVPLKLIKFGIAPLKKYVLELMRLSMQSIPLSWKTALIVPLHKAGPKTSVENYRPISNLASMSKVFEKIVLAKIDEKHPNIEGHSQHGFRKGRGTHTALLELQHELASALDNSLLVSTYSLDMSAAFDLIRPSIFHQSSGLCDPLLNVTMDFLSGRNFEVKVGDFFSTKRYLNVGCVQGSI
jgi:hypothetical protein